ncbi:MAG: class I SAM-dependent methyltransferase [Chlamydiales bacterium]|nr:class I SAM-dependent methyltransferase [Chlamydiales bacterium]
MDLSLFALALRVKWYLFCEEKRVRSLFYRHPLFRRRDRALKRAYSFHNPYRMSRKFLEKIGANEVDSYGETPLTAWDRIVEECGITKEDYVFDLGCGRGRGVFFLSDVIGCRARGIDWNPAFILKAESLREAYLGKAEPFLLQNMSDVDFEEASVIYLCGTCLEDTLIEKMAMRFSHLPKSVKIITVSLALSDYSQEFRVLKEFSVSFPWGEGGVFLNQKK